MKKLLLLALLSTIALAQQEPIKDDAKDLALQFAQPAVDAAQQVADSEFGHEVGNVLGQLFVDAPTQLGQSVKEGFNTTVDAVSTTAKDIAHKINHSKVVKGAKEVGAQISDAAQSAGNKVKDATLQVVDATKAGTQKVKDAADKIVEKTKEGAAKVKETAIEIANSDDVDDIKELGKEFAAVPREAAENIVAFCKAIKAELVD